MATATAISSIHPGKSLRTFSFEKRRRTQPQSTRNDFLSDGEYMGGVLMHRDGTPLITEGSGSPNDQELKRVTPDNVPGEQWMQAVLDRCPQILPLREVDERADPPAFSLGMEIHTPSGSIDNLFICKNGHPVVVEMKLWRNPE